MRKLFFLTMLLFISLFCASCDKSSTENETEKNSTSIYEGTWEFNYSGDITTTRYWVIGKNDEFTWKDSTSYSYLDENGRVRFDNDFYEITGNISDEGELLAIIYVSNSNPKKKCGDFTGNLNNKNGVGSFSYKISTREINCSWTAFKK